MSFKDKIFQIFDGRDGYLTAKQVYSMLNVKSTFERNAVKEALFALEKQGAILYDKRNARYCTAYGEHLFRGVMDGKAQGFGFVTAEGAEGDLFVPRSRMNGAFHGDEVLVRKVQGTQDEAEVVKVVSRGRTEIVGTYDKSARSRFVIPDDRRFYKDVFIPPKKDMGAKNGQKVVVKINVFPTDNASKPEGEVVAVLGRAGEVGVDLRSVAYSFGIKDEFPQAVAERAKKIPQTVRESDLSGRKDFRGETVVTVDGADAKDLDDAVSVRKEGDFFLLSVHIADVSHYVHPGDDVDKEAFERGTSVYFPLTVYPMLPRELSNGICSLYEGVDRLTLSCVMKMDRRGKVVDFEVTPGVINSRHRMTYDAVQSILDGDEATCKAYADVYRMILDMKSLAEVLLQKRIRRGNVEFASKEATFVVEGNEVTNVVPHERTFAHKIIEEFMIVANETVAEYASSCQAPFVYRVHEKPDEMKLAALAALLDGLGIPFRHGDELHLTAIAEALKRAEETPYFALVSDVTLRSMQKAVYSPTNVGHFGLASQCYCHFTSPIRRYPDLVVHRVLKTIVAGKMTEKAISAYEEMCAKCAVWASKAERNADEAERKADDVMLCKYASRHVGEIFDGVISGVTERGVFVELPNLVEGFVEAYLLAEDTVFDGNFARVGASVTYRIGDALKVAIDGVSVEECKVYMSLANEKDD